MVYNMRRTRAPVVKAADQRVRLLADGYAWP